MSLVMPYDLGSIRSGKQSHAGHLLRFSIGLESADDLRGDLAQALSEVVGPHWGCGTMARRTS